MPPQPTSIEAIDLHDAAVPINDAVSGTAVGQSVQIEPLPLMRDANSQGQPAEAVLTNRDAGEREQAQEALAQENKQRAREQLNRLSIVLNLSLATKAQVIEALTAASLEDAQDYKTLMRLCEGISSVQSEVDPQTKPTELPQMLTEGMVAFLEAESKGFRTAESEQMDPAATVLIDMFRTSPMKFAVLSRAFYGQIDSTVRLKAELGRLEAALAGNIEKSEWR